MPFGLGNTTNFGRPLVTVTTYGIEERKLTEQQKLSNNVIGGNRVTTTMQLLQKAICAPKHHISCADMQPANPHPATLHQGAAAFRRVAHTFHVVLLLGTPHSDYPVWLGLRFRRVSLKIVAKPVRTFQSRSKPYRFQSRRGLGEPLGGQ